MIWYIYILYMNYVFYTLLTWMINISKYFYLCTWYPWFEGTLSLNLGSLNFMTFMLHYNHQANNINLWKIVE